MNAPVKLKTQQSRSDLALLWANDITSEVVGHQLMIRGATRTAVFQLAFDNRIRLTELTETSRSLEDTLIDITSASAEFAAA